MATAPSSSQLEEAAALAGWVRDLHYSGDLDFDFGGSITYDSDSYSSVDGDAEGLGALAEGYPISGSEVPELLQQAGQAREGAYVAYQAREFAAGERHASDAVAAMKAIQEALAADVESVESACDCRIDEDGPSSVETDSESAEILEWIDGDTVETSEGRVRLIGIDTPEMNDTCSKAEDAKDNAEALAPPGSTVILGAPRTVSDTDKYGRLLRYVDVELEDDSSIDVGYSQILSSLAVARYDSRDGYEWHPREGAYRDASGPVEDALLRCLAPLAAGSYALGDDDGDDDDHLLKAIVAAALADQISQARGSRDEARDAWRDHDALELAIASTSSGSGSSAGGGGGGSGYTGPRCYDPGGITWSPC